MKKNTKNILIAIATIFIVVAIGFVGIIIYSFTSIDGCGFDDGPFTAVPVNNYELSDSVQVFNIQNGQLTIDNRHDTLSPIITLIENGVVKWSLDTDVRKTVGFETCRIYSLSSVEIENNSDPIELSFLADWTFGVEVGNMVIDRKDGSNSFCLSW